MYQMTMILQAYPWVVASNPALSHELTHKMQENPADRHAAIDMALFHDAPEAVCGDIAPSDGISKSNSPIDY